MGGIGAVGEAGQLVAGRGAAPRQRWVGRAGAGAEWRGSPDWDMPHAAVWPPLSNACHRAVGAVVAGGRRRGGSHHGLASAGGAVDPTKCGQQTPCDAGAVGVPDGGWRGRIAGGAAWPRPAGRFRARLLGNDPMQRPATGGQACPGGGAAVAGRASAGGPAGTCPRAGGDGSGKMRATTLHPTLARWLARWGRRGGASHRGLASAGGGRSVQMRQYTPCTACHRALVPVVARRWRQRADAGGPGRDLAGPGGGRIRASRQRPRATVCRRGASDRGLPRAGGAVGKCGQYPMHRLPGRRALVPGGGRRWRRDAGRHMPRGGTCLRIGGACGRSGRFAPAPRWPAPRLRL